MSKIAVHVFADPGHAWAAVPVAELVELGIAHKISAYSYRKREVAYLEEDCDLGVYIKALEARGKAYEFKEYDDKIGIRNLPGYKLSNAEKYASLSAFDYEEFGAAMAAAHKNDPAAYPVESAEQNVLDTLDEHKIVGVDARAAALAAFRAALK